MSTYNKNIFIGIIHISPNMFRLIINIKKIKWYFHLWHFGQFFQIYGIAQRGYFEIYHPNIIKKHIFLIIYKFEYIYEFENINLLSLIKKDT